MTTLEIFLSITILLLIAYIIVNGRDQRRIVRMYQDSIEQHAEHVRSLEKLRTDLVDNYRKLVEKL